MTAEVQHSPPRARPENPLSEREMDVARLLTTGASNSEIARDLTISPHTVKVHLRNIFDKLQVNSRTEASILLVQRGWIIIPGLEREQTETVVIQPPPPDPLPLADSVVRPTRWQRLYLGVVVLLCLSVIFAPSLFSRTSFGPTLLSDGSNTDLSALAIQDVPRWTQLAPLPQARSRMAAIRVNQQVYVMGGEGASGETLGNVDIYDLEFNTWTSAAPLPQPLANISAAELDDKIYLAGGSTQAAAGESISLSNALWVYSIEDNSWEMLDELPRTLAGAALVSARSSLYLIGGWDGQAMRGEMWRVDPSGATPGAMNNWELVDELDVARAYLGATALNSKIYVAGGYDGQRELDIASVYDLEAQQWSELPSLSSPRGGLALVSNGLSVFAIGGGWTEPIETNESYTPGTEFWTNFPSPVVGEWRNLAAVSREGSLYLIGGWGGDYLPQHFQYDTSLKSILLPLIRND